MTGTEKATRLQALFADLKQARSVGILNRDLAFLCPGLIIGALRFREMNLVDWTYFGMQGNRVLQGRVDNADEVGDFLWRLSEFYRPFDPKAETKFNEALALEIEAHGAAAVRDAIASFVDRMFQDGSFSTAGSAPKDSPVSGNVSIIALLAREYGWTDTHIEGIPLPKLFQYIENILRAKNIGYIKRGKTDAIKRDIQALLNQ